jgi:hypothetical protein
MSEAQEDLASPIIFFLFIDKDPLFRDLLV